MRCAKCLAFFLFFYCFCWFCFHMFISLDMVIVFPWRIRSVSSVLHSLSPFLYFLVPVLICFLVWRVFAYINYVLSTEDVLIYSNGLLFVGWSAIKVSRRGRIGFSLLQIWSAEELTLNVLTLSSTTTCQIQLTLTFTG